MCVSLEDPFKAVYSGTTVYSGTYNSVLCYLQQCTLVLTIVYSGTSNSLMWYNSKPWYVHWCTIVQQCTVELTPVYLLWCTVVKVYCYTLQQYLCRLGDLHQASLITLSWWTFIWSQWSECSVFFQNFNILTLHSKSGSLPNESMNFCLKFKR